MKKFLLSLLTFLPLHADSLLEKTQSYLQFVTRISQGEEFDQIQAANSVLAPDCKKIFNGTLFTKTSQEFVTDLVNFQKTNGNWTLLPQDIIVSKDTTVMRLFVEMEKLGRFTEMVLFRFNSDGLINEINIVFNKVEDSYGFATSKRYVDFIQKFASTNDYQEDYQTLFAENVVKIVNSNTVSRNKDELLKQMLDVKNRFGIQAIKVLQVTASMIQWEFSYDDDEGPECVITLLSYDDTGRIVEINEVFGQKNSY